MRVASDKRWILSRVPPGPGRALDVAGGSGELHAPLSARGYSYVNLDIAPSGSGELVVGDAHDLPFDDETFDLVVCEGPGHFHTPLAVFREIARVLKPGGRLVTWSRFLHPYHGAGGPVTDEDYYRFTRSGLEHLLHEARLRVVSIEAPLGVFTILAGMLVAALTRFGRGSPERAILGLALWLDRRARPDGWTAYAESHLAVAVKDGMQTDTE